MTGFELGKKAFVILNGVKNLRFCIAQFERGDPSSPLRVTGLSIMTLIEVLATTCPCEADLSDVAISRNISHNLERRSLDSARDD